MSEVAYPLMINFFHVINAFITRFLSDAVLQESYDDVTQAQQRKREDEISFATRIEKGTPDICEVFSKREVVNY